MEFGIADPWTTSPAKTEKPRCSGFARYWRVKVPTDHTLDRRLRGCIPLLTPERRPRGLPSLNSGTAQPTRGTNPIMRLWPAPSWIADTSLVAKPLAGRLSRPRTDAIVRSIPVSRATKDTVVTPPDLRGPRDGSARAGRLTAQLSPRLLVYED